MPNSDFFLKLIGAEDKKHKFQSFGENNLCCGKSLGNKKTFLPNVPSIGKKIGKCSENGYSVN